MDLTADAVDHPGPAVSELPQFFPGHDRYGRGSTVSSRRFLAGLSAGFELSVTVAVGFIALAGVAAEFGVVMMVYLNEAVKRHRPIIIEELRAVVIEGAVQRVRPKAMTASVILATMLPIMFGSGTGSEVMRRIAAPLVSMLLIPLLYLWWKGRSLARK